MAAFSDYLENKLLDATLRGLSYTSPEKTYIALFTSNPTDAGTASREVQKTQWPSYARVDATGGVLASEAWTAPTAGSTSNTKEVTFTPVDGSQSITITHMGIYDAATGGNLLFHAALTQPKTLEPSDVLSMGIGAITVALD